MDSNCKIKRQGQTLSEQGNKNGIDDKLETTFTHHGSLPVYLDCGAALGQYQALKIV